MKADSANQEIVDQSTIDQANMFETEPGVAAIPESNPYQAIDLSVLDWNPEDIRQLVASRPEEFAQLHQYNESGILGKAGIAISDYWGRTTDSLGEAMRFTYEAAPALAVETAVDFGVDFYMWASGSSGDPVDELVASMMKDKAKEQIRESTGIISLREAGENKNRAMQIRTPSVFDDSYISPDLFGGAASSVAFGVASLLVPGAAFVAVPAMAMQSIDAVFGEYASALAENPELEYDWKVASALGLLVALETVGTKFAVVDMPKMMANRAFKKTVEAAAASQLKRGFGRKLLEELMAAGVDGVEELAEEELEAIVQLMYLPEYENFRKAVSEGRFGAEQWAVVSKILRENLDARTVLIGAASYGATRAAAGIQNQARWYDLQRDAATGMAGARKTEQIIEELVDTDRERLAGGAIPVGTEVSPEEAVPSVEPVKFMDLTDDQIDRLADRLVAENRAAVDKVLDTKKGKRRKSGRQLSLWKDIIPEGQTTNQNFRQKLFERLAAARDRAIAAGAAAPIGGPPTAPEPVTADPLDAMIEEADSIVEEFGRLGLDPRSMTEADLATAEAEGLTGQLERFRELEDDIALAEAADTEFSGDVASTRPASTQAVVAAAATGSVAAEDLDVEAGTQMGSMPGGLATSRSDGKRYYTKRYKNSEQTRNEVVANALYREAGVDVPNTRLMTEGGEVVGVASEMVEGLSSETPTNAGEGFIIDAWLANWDVVGQDADNLMSDSKGRAVRIDQGGALTTRAQGSSKGSRFRFGNEVSETRTLRQKNKIFSRVSPADIRKGLNALRSISDQKIKEIVEANSTGDRVADKKLISTLIRRRRDLLKQQNSLIASSEAEFSADTDALESDAVTSTISRDGRTFELVADDKLSETERNFKSRYEQKSQGRRVQFVRQTSGGNVNGFVDPSISADTVFVVVRDVEATAARIKSGSKRLSALAKKQAMARRKGKVRAEDVTATEEEIRLAYEDYLLQVGLHENFHLEDIDSAPGVREVAHRLLSFVIRTRATEGRVFGVVRRYREMLAAAKTEEDLTAAERYLSREIRAESVSDMFYMHHSGTAAAFYDRGLMNKVRSRLRRVARKIGNRGDANILNRLMINAPKGYMPLASYPGAAITAQVVNANYRDIGIVADEMELTIDGELIRVADGAVAPIFRPEDEPKTSDLPGPGTEFSADTPYEYEKVVDDGDSMIFTFSEYEGGPQFKVTIDSGGRGYWSLMFSTRPTVVAQLGSSQEMERMRRGAMYTPHPMEAGLLSGNFNRERLARENVLQYRTSTMEVLASESPGRVFATILECCKQFYESYKGSFTSLTFTAAGESTAYETQFGPAVTAPASIGAMTSDERNRLEVRSLLDQLSRPYMSRMTIIRAINDSSVDPQALTAEQGGLIASELRARRAGSRLRGGIGRDAAAPSIELIPARLAVKGGGGRKRGKVYRLLAKRMAKELGLEVMEGTDPETGEPSATTVRVPVPDKKFNAAMAQASYWDFGNRPEAAAVPGMRPLGRVQRETYDIMVGANERRLAGDIPGMLANVRRAIDNLYRDDSNGDPVPVLAVWTGSAPSIRSHFDMTSSQADRVSEAAQNTLSRHSTSDEDMLRSQQMMSAIEDAIEQSNLSEFEISETGDDPLAQVRFLMQFGRTSGVQQRTAEGQRRVPTKKKTARRPAAARRTSPPETPTRIDMRTQLTNEIARITAGDPGSLNQSEFEGPVETVRRLVQDGFLTQEQARELPQTLVEWVQWSRDKVSQIASAQFANILDRPPLDMAMVATHIMKLAHPVHVTQLSVAEMGQVRAEVRGLVQNLRISASQMRGLYPSGHSRYEVGWHAAAVKDMIADVIHERVAYAWSETVDGYSIDPNTLTRENYYGGNEYVAALSERLRPTSQPDGQTRSMAEEITELLDSLGSAEYSGDLSVENSIEDVPFVDIARAIESPTPDNLMTVMAIRRAFGNKNADKNGEFPKVPEDDVRAALHQLGVEVDDDAVAYIADNYFREVSINETLSVSVGKSETFAVAGDVERAMSLLFDQNPSPTAEQLATIPGAPEPAEGVVVTPMKGSPTERRVKTFIANAKKTVALADGRYAETSDAEEIEGLLAENDVVMFTGEGGPVIHANRPWLDRFAKPADYATIKQVTIEAAKAGYHNWYREFGKLFYSIGGERALNEAAFVFGVTSAQSAVEQNLTDTLHIMLLVRQYKASGRPWNMASLLKFLKEAPPRENSNTKNGTIGMFVSGKQLKPIAEFYVKGPRPDSKNSIKTRTYTGQVAEAGLNNFYPMSVQDRHQAAMYGFLRGSFNESNGTFNYDKVFGRDPETRYATYLTGRLALEPELRGLTPSQIQAAQWFSIKAGTGPYPQLEMKADKGGPLTKFRKENPDIRTGTMQSATMFGVAEIQRLKEMFDDPSIPDDIKYLAADRKPPSYLHMAYGGVQYGSGMSVARRLADTMRSGAASVTLFGIPFVNAPGLTRSSTMNEHALREMSHGLIRAVTESDGSVRIFNDMGIPHSPLLGMQGRVGRTPHFGLHLTPLLGSISDAATARVVGSVIGLGTMQPRMATMQPSPEGRGLAIRISESNNEPLTSQQADMIMSRMSALRFGDGEIYQMVSPANGFVEVVVNPASGVDLNIDAIRSEFNKIIEDIQNESGIRLRGEGHRKEIEVIASEDFAGNIKSSGIGLAGGSDLLPRVLREVATPTLEVLRANGFSFNRQDFLEGLRLDADQADAIGTTEFSGELELGMPDFAEQRTAMSTGSVGNISDDPTTLPEAAALETKWWSSLTRAEREAITFWVHSAGGPALSSTEGLTAEEAQSIRAMAINFPGGDAFSNFRGVATGKHGSWQHTRLFGSELPINVMASGPDSRLGPFEGEINQAISRGIASGMKRIFSSPRKPVVKGWIRDLFVDENGQWLNPDIRYIPDAGPVGYVGVKYDGDLSDWSTSSYFNYDGQNYILLGEPVGRGPDGNLLTVGDIVTSILGSMHHGTTSRERLVTEAFPDGNIPGNIDRIPDEHLIAMASVVSRSVKKQIPWHMPDIRSALAAEIYAEIVKVEGNNITMTEQEMAPLYRALISGLSKAPTASGRTVFRACAATSPAAFVARFGEGDVFRIEAPASMTVSAETALNFAEVHPDGLRYADFVKPVQTRGRETLPKIGSGPLAIQNTTIVFIVDDVKTARSPTLSSMRASLRTDVVQGKLYAGLQSLSSEEGRRIGAIATQAPRGVLQSLGIEESKELQNRAEEYVKRIRSEYDEGGATTQFKAEASSASSIGAIQTDMLIRAEISSFYAAVAELTELGVITQEQEDQIFDATVGDDFFVAPHQNEAEVVAMPGSTYRIKEINSDGNVVILEEVEVSDADAADLPVFAEFSSDLASPVDPDSEPMSDTDTVRNVKWRNKGGRRRIQDRFIELDYLQRDLAEAFGRPLDVETEDAVNKFRLIPGQLNQKGQRFRDREMIPFANDVRLAGLNMEEFGEYAVAMHALAVNADLRTRNPAAAAGDIDSGMSDAEATRVINAMLARKDVDIREVESLRRRLVTMSRRTLRIAKNSGLITQSEFDSLTTRFPDYVPMWNPFDPETERLNEGREQFIIPSNVLMGRTGRTANSLAGNGKFFADRLGAVADQRYRVMRKAAQNEALKRLLKLTQELNNSELLEVYKPGVRRYSDPRTGQIRTTRDDSWKTDPTVFSVMVGGQRVLLKIKHPELAEAIKAKRVPPNRVLGAILKTMSFYTGFFRFFTTQFGNVGFTLTNPVRDVQTASATVLGERNKSLVKATEAGDLKQLSLVDRVRIVVNSGVSLIPAFGATLGLATEGVRRDYAKYRTLGGQQGFFRDQDPAKVRKQLIAAARSGVIRRNISTIVQSPAWLWDKVNVMFDDGIRFAVWRQLVKQGVNPEKAIETTRDLTVDFSKMGTWGPNINALYAYANANVQGPVKTLRLLKSKTGVSVFGAYILAGVISELMGDTEDDRDENGIPDWEEIPDYQRDGNFMFPVGEGFGEDGTRAGFIAIPIAYGLDIPFVFGRRLVRMMRGRDTLSEGIMAVLGTTVNGFVPGGARTALSSDDPQDLVHGIGRILMPDIGDPFLDLAMNRDWLNNPIYTESPYDPLPNRGYAARPRTRDNLSTSWAADLTEMLNDATGGNEAVPGKLSIQPEWITYMLTAPFGGSGKSATRAIDALGRKMHNDWLMENYPDEALTVESNVNDIPGLRRFLITTPNDYATGEAFYEMKGAYDRATTAIRRQTEAGLLDEADADYVRAEPLMVAEPEFKQEERLRKEMKQVLTQLRREGASQNEMLLQRRRYQKEIRSIQEYAVKSISEATRAEEEARTN